MTTPAVAYFISPHGFGHATRSVAVMQAIHRRRPAVVFHLFTTVPGWVFSDSLAAPFHLHRVRTDVGLVQQDALTEDPAATADALARLIPPTPSRMRRLSNRVVELGCRAVVSDISPLGILVARQAGLPAILIENFTWDWIYQAYTDVEPRLHSFIAELAEIFGSSEVHLQAEPCCAPSARADQIPPVSRRVIESRESVRRRLREPGDRRPLVLLTMGGIPWRTGSLDALTARRDLVFVLPGSARSARRENLVLLPHRTGFQHTDLVNAADVLVGKLGYSTLAEAYRAGTPLVYVQRPRFPESPVLAAFARRHLPAVEVGPDDLARHAWLDKLEPLLAAARPKPARPDGAPLIARRLLPLLD